MFVTSKLKKKKYQLYLPKYHLFKTMIILKEISKKIPTII